jgi:hypothetical protein
VDWCDAGYMNGIVIIQRNATFTPPLLAVLYRPSEPALKKAKRVRTVNQLRTVVDNSLDGPLLLEMPDSYPGEAAIDFQPLNQDRL